MTGKTIQVTIRDEAKELIKKHMKPGQVVTLASDGGSDRYSILGSTCTIGADFQLIVTDQKDPKYPVVMENNAGLKIYASSNELGFLINGLLLNTRDAVISLYDNSGVVDGTVAVRERTPHELTAKETKNGKTC